MKRQWNAVLSFALAMALAVSLSFSVVAVAAEPEVIDAPYSGYIVKLRQSEAETFSVDDVPPEGLTPVLPQYGYYRINCKEDAAALIDAGMVELLEPDYEAELFDLDEAEYSDPDAAEYFDLDEAGYSDPDEAEPLGVDTAADTAAGTTPNDPMREGKQTNLPLIGMEYAWEQGLTGEGVTVAVIDSGYTPRHEDVPLTVLPGKYFYYVADPSGDVVLKIGGKEGRYSAKVEEDTPEKIVTEDDYKTAACAGHGTRLAGIIAARTNNGVGVAGIAPTVSLLPIRCFTSTPGHVGAYTANLAKGIEFAVEQKADIINMSWGIRVNSSILREAIDRAYEAGAILVASAGNDGGNDANSSKPPDSLIYPAVYDTVISVGSTDNNGDVSYFSQRNGKTLVSAPGSAIYAPTFERTSDGYYNKASGTSFSTPTVTAVLALMKAEEKTLTIHQLKLLLAGTAVPLRTDAKLREFGGYGLIDVEKLMLRTGNPMSSAEYHEETEGSITVNGHLFSGSRETGKAYTALLGAYNAQGHMVSVQTASVTSTGGLVDVSFPLTTHVAGESYRVFFLDPITLAPVASAAHCTRNPPPPLD